MWPFSRLTTYVATSTPVISAADLNALQDIVIDVLTGVQLVKKLLLDGVASDLTEVLLTSVAPASGALRHWAKIRCTSSIYVHLYSNENGLVITYNAAYTGTGGAEWHQEDASVASILFAVGKGYGITTAGLSSAVKDAGASDWANWDWGVANAGRIIAKTPRASSTPGGGQAVFAGIGYVESFPLALGVFLCTGAGASLMKGIGIDGVSRSGTGVYVVDITAAPTSYSVPQVTPLTTIAIHGVANITGASQITVYLWDAGGVAVDANFSLALWGV